MARMKRKFMLSQFIKSKCLHVNSSFFFFFFNFNVLSATQNESDSIVKLKAINGDIGQIFGP